MWKWLKQQFTKIKNFFVALFRREDPVDVSAASDASVSEGGTAQQDSPDAAQDSQQNHSSRTINKALGEANNPIIQLKKNMLTNVEDAKKLLLRTDLKDHLSPEELCELIHTHRSSLDINFIEYRLYANKISLLELAHHSAKNALLLLKSRFLILFKADELARIYDTHAQDQNFYSALIESSKNNTQYPNQSYIPPVSFILDTARIEKNSIQVIKIIEQNPILRDLSGLRLNPKPEKVNYHGAGNFSVPESAAVQQHRASADAAPGEASDPISQLKQNMFTNVRDAAKLFQRTDLKKHLTPEQLCELIYMHRRNLDPRFIQQSLKNNQVSFLELAQNSAKNALLLLKSRFLRVFRADELARIYYTHRHDQDFYSALVVKRAPEMSYPDAEHIPPVSYILINAHKEKKLETVFNIIRQSATLLFIFYNECNQQPNNKPRQAAAEVPKINPYAVLGLKRDADDKAIKKAFREQARLFHPDKCESVAGNRFKAANEAYQCLMDPEKRRAWDEAHPEETSAPSVRR
ncbi:J domain-containing protein [Legionella worsleiensis]|uniref:Curved DNA binding protein DnaJ n=1 Tax=Legionella worsleiensis TaxID=45076 RepID=A0A0W1AKN8_9GAMM|nr:J domain-containing protein [Legionella worsleiensis]KTD81892.1 curved DNA binding protein DnaJ [Legionella worsleiensis]STY31194.1 curved DNA binding protein DnaJ [Legionella worsleiensis]